MSKESLELQTAGREASTPFLGYKLRQFFILSSFVSSLVFLLHWFRIPELMNLRRSLGSQPGRGWGIEGYSVVKLITRQLLPRQSTSMNAFVDSWLATSKVITILFASAILLLILSAILFFLSNILYNRKWNERFLLGFYLFSITYAAVAGFAASFIAQGFRDKFPENATSLLEVSFMPFLLGGIVLALYAVVFLTVTKQGKAIALYVRTNQLFVLKVVCAVTSLALIGAFFLKLIEVPLLDPLKITVMDGIKDRNEGNFGAADGGYSVIGMITLLFRLVSFGEFRGQFAWVFGVTLVTVLLALVTIAFLVMSAVKSVLSIGRDRSKNEIDPKLVTLYKRTLASMSVTLAATFLGSVIIMIVFPAKSASYFGVTSWFLAAVVLTAICVVITQAITSKRFRLTVYKNYQLYLMVIPGMVMTFIFGYIPLYGVQIAFKNFNSAAGIWGSPWIGFKHFLDMFNYPFFGNMMRNTLLISFYELALFFLPIIVALLLNEIRSKAYKKTIQMVTYMPHFLSIVVVCGLIRLILGFDNGIINSLIEMLGGERFMFLSNAPAYYHIYVWSGVWQSLGYSMIIYIAALSGVSPELVEAAVIDGATRIRIIRSINIPAIVPTIIILFIMASGTIMTVGFEKALLIANQGNMERARIISLQVYNLGVIGKGYSLSTAMGLFTNVINLALLLITNFISGRVSEVSLW